MAGRARRSNLEVTKIEPADFTRWDLIHSDFTDAMTKMITLGETLRKLKKPRATVPVPTLALFYINQYNAYSLAMYKYVRTGEVLVSFVQSDHPKQRLMDMKEDAYQLMQLIGYSKYLDGSIDYQYRGFYQWQHESNDPSQSWKYSDATYNYLTRFNYQSYVDEWHR